MIAIVMVGQTDDIASSNEKTNGDIEIVNDSDDVGKYDLNSGDVAYDI